MKKFIIAVLAAALLLGAGAGVSYAYLSAWEDVGNEFKTAEVTISIQEEFDPPGEVAPGQTIKKAPRIESTSDTDCYVRAAVYFSSSDMQALCEPLVIKEGWELQDDGYYYWKQPLKPGEKTDAIFESIVIKQDAAMLEPFDVLVYGEAVQCGALSENEAWSVVSGFV